MVRISTSKRHVIMINKTSYFYKEIIAWLPPTVRPKAEFALLLSLCNTAPAVPEILHRLPLVCVSKVAAMVRTYWGKMVRSERKKWGKIIPQSGGQPCRCPFLNVCQSAKNRHPEVHLLIHPKLLDPDSSQQQLWHPHHSVWKRKYNVSVMRTEWRMGIYQIIFMSWDSQVQVLVQTCRMV